MAFEYGDVIKLEGTDGDEHEFEFLGQLEHNGSLYAVLGEDAYDENGNAIIGEDGVQEVDIEIFLVISKNEDGELEEVEDLEVAQAVFNLWCNDGFGDEN